MYSMCIHDRSIRRDKMIDCFRLGLIPILIVTDINAKGLVSIPNIKHIINYDLTSDIDESPLNIHMDEYVTRTIHTGREGNTGLVTSFFNDKNMNMARELVKVFSRGFQSVPTWLLELATKQ